MKQERIAFIAHKEYVNTMRFAGFECFPVTDKERAVEKLRELEEEDYALIFISQDVAPDKIGLERVVVLPGIIKKKDEKFLQEEISKAIGGEMQL